MMKMNETNGDIDCFIKKVDAVNAAIMDLKDGKIDPQDVRVEGIPTDEERRQKEAQRIAAEEKLAKEINDKKEKCKVQEKELWWRTAELVHGGGSKKEENRGGAEVLGSGCDECSSSEIMERLNDDENRLCVMYNTEYSRWDRWEPDDPATRDENEARKESEERIQVIII